MVFKEFNKIARLNRGMVVTEKIDGTNAQVYIESNLVCDNVYEFGDCHKFQIARNETHTMFAGSRTRWITPTEDNYGFAGWVQRNSSDLFILGEGQHFGEWWGNGIQRRYNQTEKRFSLFNVARWADRSLLPSCVDTVPVIYQGAFDNAKINEIIEDLKVNGSKAAPGYMTPEGIVVFHVASRTLYKVTCEKDASPKSLVE